jgi:hypothetical protein
MSVPAAYDWLEDRLERGDQELVSPCQAAPSLAFRQAVVRGDVGRARSILRKFGAGALDVPRLGDVMHAVVQLGLAQCPEVH